ncbi:MAG: ATP-binding protein [Armatimonadota bacterium]
MQIPNFNRETIDPAQLGEGPGDAFQRFAAELVRLQHPDWHCYPTGGKDGAIDLRRTATSERMVIECKHIGEDGLTESQQRWRKVAVELSNNLAAASGPPPGQGQYRPWYDGEHQPIRMYQFWVSSSIGNENQHEALCQEIKKFFVDLAAKHQHLAHLADIAVEVHDWLDCTATFCDHPYLAFRWFPSMRPNGLIPLAATRAHGTFRDYLEDERLPYYSRMHHLAAHHPPDGVVIPDEEALFQALIIGEAEGLVISGAGGVGKTRLMLELGRRAEENGWSVFRVEAISDAVIDALASELKPETPALLLVDYLETMPDFSASAGRLIGIREVAGIRIAYVACCRTSYYPNVMYDLPDHRQLDMSPIDTVTAWYAGYAHAAVRHILVKGGFTVTQAHLETCRDLPILAVFLCYLHANNRSEELTELLAVRDFGAWLSSRLKMTLGREGINRDLAILMALLPLTDEALRRIFNSDIQPIFDKLAADRWVELLAAPAGTGARWEAIHDVLADQCVLVYAHTIRLTVSHFVDEVFTTAETAGWVQSALVTFQRIGNTPPFTEISWAKIISHHLTANHMAWRATRVILLKTSLLTPAQKIQLLHDYDVFWDGMEHDGDFQGALAWLGRCVNQYDAKAVSDEERATLLRWLLRAAPYSDVNSMVLTVGIQLQPYTFDAYAIQWLHAHCSEFKTRYLLVAWLDAHLPLADVEGILTDWTKQFGDTPRAEFVYVAWLNARGEKEVVQADITRWLVKFEAIPEASFVYQAWLKARGEKKVVQTNIEHWLVEHAMMAEAQFIYTAWLDSGLSHFAPRLRPCFLSGAMGSNERNHGGLP